MRRMLNLRESAKDKRTNGGQNARTVPRVAKHGLGNAPLRIRVRYVKRSDACALRLDDIAKALSRARCSIAQVEPTAVWIMLPECSPRSCVATCACAKRGLL